MKSSSYVEKRIQAFYFACKGLYSFFKKEKHVQIHVIIAFIVIFSAWFLSISTYEWIICLLCIALVISLELINSAIEQFANVVNSEPNKHIEYIKDISAAAVLIAAIVSSIIGLLIFIPKLI